MDAIEQQVRTAENIAIFDWRFETLIHAGYLPDQAWSLATSKDVDVRLAERLLSEGCPRATAIRILL